MSKFWEIFENLNEYVYVSDIDTDEVVYANKKMLYKCGINSLDDVEGKKCYEIIHNCSERCAMCNNNDICVGQFNEWWYYSPIIKSHLVVKTTMIEEKGRRLRLEFAFDTRKFDWQHHSYQNIESIVNEGLRLSSMESNTEKSIEVLLEYLGKALNGERTYIFEKNDNGCDDNTYEWTAAGISPEKGNLQGLPPEICKEWYDTFRENMNIVIKDVESLRNENILMYQTLKKQNISSLVVVALYDNRKIIGFYGVDNPPSELLEYATNILQMMGYFIVSLIRRRNLMEKLKIMSFTDQLTGLGNRHSMTVFIQEKLGDYEKMGVVYCDITGLKHINDTKGHEAGDKYIISACECLSDAFRGFKVFRIGGDEMLVLCKDVEQEEFNGRNDILFGNLKEKNVVMAVGSVWSDKSDDIDKMINEAEEIMYKDKAEYYKRHGIDRRIV